MKIPVVVDRLTINRIYTNVRTNMANWECRKYENQTVWKVHFHADYLPSEDFECTDDNLLITINSKIDLWKNVIDLKWSKHNR
jgi:hypothetical protein